MSRSNPYQSSHVLPSDSAEFGFGAAEAIDGQAISDSSRRFTQIGRGVLGGYFAVLLMVWLANAYSFHFEADLGLRQYLLSHDQMLMVLLVVMALGGLGGVLCSSTPRRERAYLWVASACKALVIAVASRVLFRVTGGQFAIHLLPLFSAVLFAMWMIAEAALLGFLRATAIRNKNRVAAHLCEIAIGTLAVVAGCYSSWAILELPLSGNAATSLFLVITFGFSIVQLIALYVLRWYPIIDRSSRQSSP